MKLKIFNKEIAITDILFPIGSIYWTEDASFSPSSTFGGTWEKITDRFLYSCNDDEEPGNQGGNSSVTISANNIPRHRHTVNSHYHSAYAVTSISLNSNNKGSVSSTSPSGSVTIYTNSQNGKDTASNSCYISTTVTFSIPNHGHTYTDPTYSISSTTYAESAHTNSNRTGTSSPGTSSAYTKNPTAISIIPPYEIAICWKRTA